MGSSVHVAIAEIQQLRRDNREEEKGRKRKKNPDYDLSFSAPFCLESNEFLESFIV